MRSVFGEPAYVRGDVFELKSDKLAKGHEQSGARYAVIMQSNSLPLSTVLVAPTSTKRGASSFRPEIILNGRTTRVLAEQLSSIDPQVRLGRKITHLSFDDMRRISTACATVLDL